MNWFGIISIVFLIMVSWFIPKRLTWIEMVTTALFATLFGDVVDEIFDLKFDLYGYLNKGVDFFGELSQLTIYPTLDIIYLNYFPWGKNLFGKVIYILFWSVGSICYERMAVYTHFFYYNGWKTRYSALAYPVIYIILALVLRLVRKREKV